jgi:hypothetical protein
MVTPNIKSFVVTYDRLYDKAINCLTQDERDSLVCYGIQKSVPKDVTNLISKRVNEWELPWNDYSYQSKQYYEYGTMVHILKNPELVSDATHIGLFHYDVLFGEGSVNDMMATFSSNPNTIFYSVIRNAGESLYLTPYQFMNICSFMSQRIGMDIKPETVWNNGWISEAISVVPKDVLLRFARYLSDFSADIESILIQNKWGIMNGVNHRVCGIVERMWGIYLVSCGMNIRKMNVLHDWSSYQHKHQEQSNWIRS